LKALVQKDPVTVPPERLTRTKRTPASTTSAIKLFEHTPRSKCRGDEASFLNPKQKKKKRGGRTTGQTSEEIHIMPLCHQEGRENANERSVPNPGDIGMVWGSLRS